MNDLVTLITTFVDSVALVMALVLAISLVHRSYKRDWMNNVLMSGMFAFAVAFTMSDPFSLPSGGVYDMRTLLIGTSAALLGPAVGFSAFVTGMAFRWGIGGDSAIVGMVGIVLTYAAGTIWWFVFFDRPWAVWKKTLLLGIMISANSFAIILTPQEFWQPLMVNLVPYIFASNIVGSLLLHHLLRGELSFQSAADSSHIDARTDHLTGLLNRRGLDLVYPRLKNVSGQNRGRALLYFDIDRFKDVNDTHGHAVGDAVLKYVTDQIAGHLRPQDIFARLGGDEFTVVLNQIDAREAETIAQRCCYIVANGGFVHDGSLVQISISVGAIWMLEHTAIDDILDHADKALYVAKTSGRNKVVFQSKKPAARCLNAGLAA